MACRAIAAFGFVDEDGRLFNNKRNGPMVTIDPTWDEATRQLSLRFPDGAEVGGTVELGDPTRAVLYRRPHPSRRVIGPWEEAISTFVGRPLTLLWSEGHATDRGQAAARSRWCHAALSNAFVRRPGHAARSTVAASG